MLNIGAFLNLVFVELFELLKLNKLIKYEKEAYFK